jgi:transposase
MRRLPPTIALPAEDRVLLERWIRAGTTPQRVAMRARIVLLASEGLSNNTIADRLGVSPHTVALWRSRYRAGGPSILQQDAAGRGRRPLGDGAAARIAELLATPREDGMRWTVRRLAEATGISRATVDRILRSNIPRRT